MSLIKQRGYLSIIAVLFIVMIGFLGIAVVYMVVGSAISTNNFALSETAFYIAEGGLNKATRFLLTPTLSNRISCAALNGNTNLTNSTFGKGAFTVTSVSGAPYDVNTTLSSALTTSSTSIPVTSTAGFAASGRILIDGEAITYANVSGNSFIDLIRGANNTLISSHTSGTYVSQLQCFLDSIGAIPSVTSPLWKRELQVGVEMQDAYAVGVNTGGDFVVIRWNQPTELAWNNVSFTNASNTTLNEVDMLSNAEGWAVGNAVSTSFIYVHLLGTTATVLVNSGACSGQNLFSVSAVSSRDAWAVGVRYQANCKNGNYFYTVNHWNGSTWTQLTPSTTPTIPASGSSANISNLNAVHVIDTNGDGTGDFGFAVGDAGTILQYNGTAWTKIASPTTQALNGVYVVSTTEAWAVGAAGVIIKWNGTSWSSVSSPTTTALNSIVMLDTLGTGTASTGWAVGNASVAVTYNGTTWSSQNMSGSVNHFGVKMYASNDVWSVGAGGAISHWDGSAWTSVSSGVTTQLNSIAIISPKIAPSSSWQEVFP